MAKKNVHITISGLVQGVNFRWEAKKEAERIGICGFARNERDGTVFIEAEGEEHELLEFIAWCRKGPSFSAVEDIHVVWRDELKNFTGFVIK